MKQIRRSVFETNSSSSHSFTLLSKTSDEQNSLDAVLDIIEKNNGTLDIRDRSVNENYISALPKIVYLHAGLCTLIFGNMYDNFMFWETNFKHQTAENLKNYIDKYLLLFNVLEKLLPRLTAFPMTTTPFLDFDCGGEHRILEILKTEKSIMNFILNPAIVLHIWNESAASNNLIKPEQPQITYSSDDQDIYS